MKLSSHLFFWRIKMVNSFLFFPKVIYHILAEIFLMKKIRFRANISFIERDKKPSVADLNSPCESEGWINEVRFLLLLLELGVNFIAFLTSWPLTSCERGLLLLLNTSLNYPHVLIINYLTTNNPHQEGEARMCESVLITCF